MAGIKSAAMASSSPAAMAAGSGAPPPAPPQGGDDPEPNVSPEEQAQYDDFVKNGMKLIYQNGRVAPVILKQLQGQWEQLRPMLGQIPPDEGDLDPKNPIDNLAVTTVGIILALETSAAQAKKQLDPAVVLHGGAELLSQLADVADAAKIHTYPPEELEAAANRAALIYGVSSKSVDPKQAADEFQHFLQSQGPGLEQALSQGQGGEAAGAAPDAGAQPQPQPQPQGV